jgi:hypothetical protein
MLTIKNCTCNKDEKGECRNCAYNCKCGCDMQHGD